MTWLPGTKIHESPIQTTAAALVCACAQVPPPSEGTPPSRSVLPSQAPSSATAAQIAAASTAAADRDIERDATIAADDAGRRPAGRALFAEPAPHGRRGDAPSARLRLDVRGDVDCVSRANLAARINARTAQVKISDEAPLSARVTVNSTRPGTVTADLILGSEPPRRVTARSCSEVADGLGLIIAVTLDPTLRSQVQKGPPPDAGVPVRPPSQPKPAPSTAAAPHQQPTATAKPTPVAKSSAPSAVQPPPPPTAAPATVTQPPRAQPWPARQFDASVAGQTIFGPAPAAMPGVALYVTVALDRPGPWAPALMVGAVHVWRSDLVERGGTASFTLDAGSLDACPLRLRWSRLTARPCMAALVGRLAAQGSNTSPALSVARPFAAAGAALSASYGSTFEVSARLGLGVTVVRYAYEFANDVFHRAGLFVVSASLGIGARWR